jgi:AcrR family transcriptional regulator
MPSDREGAAARGARHGIGNGVSAAGRRRVEEIQRLRLLGAMVEVVAEHGLAEASVARVVARAGVSRRTFYELFEDREQCFLAAFDAAVAQVSRYVLDAYEPSSRWDARLRTALTALLCFLDAERGAGYVLVVGSLGAGATALERRRRVLAQMIAVVDEGRGQAKAGSPPPPLTAEGVVGGALSIVHTRLLQPDAGPLVELAGALMAMIVLPYLGPAAARRELERSVSHPRLPALRTDGDPLRELGMRLTYRTVRVLMAVAAEPGSSNRQVGVAAGIADQGQISKLLARLQRLGLVHNAGLPPGKGAPNAWALTEKGTQVERVMSAGNDPPSVGTGSRGAR